MNSKQPLQRDDRTKQCGRCREQLPWDAAYCPNCGAGKDRAREKAKAEARAEAKAKWAEVAEARAAPNWWKSRWGLLTLALALMAIVAGGVLLWPGAEKEDVADLIDKAEREQELKKLRTDLLTRIEAFSANRTRLEEKAQARLKIAKMQEELEEDEKADESKDTAVRLMAEAERAAAAVGTLKERLREVEAELAELGSSP